jgi:predicted DNA-binding protein with PD1-like motif
MEKEEPKTQKHPVNKSPIEAHVIRLLPYQDLYVELKKYIQDNEIDAAFIMSCVGSLRKINIRTAAGGNTNRIFTTEQCFEIVSLVGCISRERSHLHIGLTDNLGQGMGGHLLYENNLVYTTAEIVLGVLPSLKFSEFQCEKSGWPELQINSKGEEKNINN